MNIKTDVYVSFPELIQSAVIARRTQATPLITVIYYYRLDVVVTRLRFFRSFPRDAIGCWRLKKKKTYLRIFLKKLNIEVLDGEIQKKNCARYACRRRAKEIPLEMIS